MADIYALIENHPSGVWSLGKDKDDKTRKKAYEYIKGVFEANKVLTPYFKNCSLDEAYAYCIGYGATKALLAYDNTALASELVLLLNGVEAVSTTKEVIHLTHKNKDYTFSSLADVVQWYVEVQYDYFNTH